jgi:hypothetical protein
VQRTLETFYTNRYAACVYFSFDKELDTSGSRYANFSNVLV